MESYIKCKVYSERTQPKMDKYCIMMNTVVDIWIGMAREEHNGSNLQSLYLENGVMVHIPNDGLIYGDIRKVW